jgi:hypothetical protein
MIVVPWWYGAEELPPRLRGLTATMGFAMLLYCAAIPCLWFYCTGRDYTVVQPMPSAHTASVNGRRALVVDTLLRKDIHITAELFDVFS